MSEVEKQTAADPVAEEKAKVDFGASVGDSVEYSLPEGISIGGETTFKAEVIALTDDGKARLKFLPVGAAGEFVEHGDVPNGPGSGQWLAYPLEDESKDDNENLTHESKT